VSARSRLVAAALALGAWGALGAVTVELQVVVMLKVLTYDQGFEKRVPNDFVLLVPVNKDDAAQAAVLKALQPVGATFLNKHAVRLKTVAADSWSSIETGASAVLLLPGTPSAGLDQWAAAAAEAKLYTLSLVPLDASEKVMFSVDTVEGKPQLVVNHKLTAAVGVSLPPSVLKVARVVR
jgi:hypothetical protein